MFVALTDTKQYGRPTVKKLFRLTKWVFRLICCLLRLISCTDFRLHLILSNMADVFSCYILDDESPAHVVLTKYISRVPYLKLIGEGYDPFEALEEIQQHQPRLLFLDVEMPYMSGVDFLKVLPKPHPIIIMVTASPQFAAETYNFDSVAHYILKPIGFDKFLEAVQRAVKRLGMESEPPAVVPSSSAQTEPNSWSVDPAEPIPYFFIKEDKKLVRVAPDDIVFVEGMKDYLKIHLKSRVLITHMTMSKLEELLPATSFLRINRSYIVNRHAIREIEGNQIVTADNSKLTIGITYRDRVMDELKKNTL